MTTKATGLYAKSRRAVDGGVSKFVSQNLELCGCPTKTARKRPQTERNGHCPC